ncbi:MAG: FHA domain-containing protein [Bdellovibrionaceae bacterium]|nr:FHA domain-containing protein [Pseudobdellovibrionaceae bacterium]
MAKLYAFHNGKLIKELSLITSDEYIIGRDATADIQLGASKGVSRQHLKLNYIDGDWVLEVLSQFGNVHYEGEEVDELLLDVNCQFKLPPYDFQFKLDEKPSRVKTDEPAPEKEIALSDLPPLEMHNEIAPPPPIVEHPPIEALPNLPAINSSNEYKAPQNIALDSFSDEKTSLGNTQNLVGIIKWRDRNGKKKGYKFSEGSCVVGRGENCDVTIKNNKMSRRQFEITKKKNLFSIIDLGSANGTKVNNKDVGTHQPVNLESGDQISISGFLFSFEIKDAQFVKKLSNIPVVQPSAIPLMPLPPQAAGARVVRVSKNQQRRILTDTNARTKLIRLSIIGAISILVVGLLFMEDKKPEKGTTDSPSKVVTFDKLITEEKQIVVDSFKLGKNHFNQKKYANCVKEFEKIHKIIPYYQNSKEISGLCEQALALEREVLVEEEKDRKQHEVEIRINVMVDDCKARMSTFKTSEEANACIAEALTMFPDHPGILDFQNAVLIKEQQEKDLAENKARRQALVSKGDSLYGNALSEYKKEKFRKAIDKYMIYLDGNYPDPQGYREKAQREVASAKEKLQSKVDTLFGDCRKFYDERKFKESIETCDKAIEEDPKNSEVVSFKKNVLSELRKEMKLLYEDAILEEALGNVDAAKEKWKKILELDISSDDYYKKATSKLKKFGIGI